MKYFKILFISLLLSSSLFAQTKARAEPIEIWVFSLYTAETMRNRLAPVVSHLESETDQTYFITSSSDIGKLKQRCEQGVPPIIIAGTIFSDKIEAHCNYHKIAVTHQGIVLFALKSSPHKTPEEVKRIGLIRHINSSQVAEAELPAINGDYDSVFYPTLYSLISHYQKDGIDALALPLNIIKSIPMFYEKWQAIHTFKTQGVTAVIAADTIDKKIVEDLTRTLLKNHSIARRVWQEDIGLGPFVVPETQERH